jgi:hypothetical protein
LKLYFSVQELTREAEQLNGALFQERLQTWLVAIPAIFIIYLLYCVSLRWLASRHAIVDSAEWRLAQPVVSLPELESYAKQFLDRARQLVADFSAYSFRKFWPARVVATILHPVQSARIHNDPYDLLHDPNPQYRYAAALLLTEWAKRRALTAEASSSGQLALPSPSSDEQQSQRNGTSPWSDPFVRACLAAFRREQVAVVRRALATALGKATELSSLDKETDVSEIDDFVYWIEAAVGKEIQNLPNGPAKEVLPLKYYITWPKPFRVVFELVRHAGLRSFDDALLRVMEMFIAHKDCAKHVRDAFRQGLERTQLSFLADLSDLELRQATQAFSPLVRGGLGTYDHLRVMDYIDLLFLFFCQARMYKDQGELLWAS